MPTVITAPSHLAGAIVRSTVRPADGPPWHITDRQHPTDPMQVVAPAAADCTTREMTPRQLSDFRRYLGPAPEPADVDAALDDIERDKNSPVVQVRIAPFLHADLVASVGGDKGELPGLFRTLARQHLREREIRYVPGPPPDTKGFAAKVRGDQRDENIRVDCIHYSVDGVLRSHLNTRSVFAVIPMGKPFPFPDGSTGQTIRYVRLAWVAYPRETFE